MPSAYRQYAVSHDGINKIDLLHNHDDAIFSAAFYLQKNGWQRGQLVALPVQVRGSKYKKYISDTCKQ